MRSGSNQRSGCMCTNQHTEKKLGRVKMAACGWGGWDLNSRFFAIRRFLWIHIYTVIERIIISTSFTRLSVILDWPHDIYTLRGSPVARDWRPAQWQVFYCVEKRNLYKIYLQSTVYIIRGCIYERCWYCHACVFGFQWFKSPPSGLKQGPASWTILVSLPLSKQSVQC